MPPFCQHIFFNAQDVNSTSRDKYFMRVRNAGKINLRARLHETRSNVKPV